MVRALRKILATHVQSFAVGLRGGAVNATISQVRSAADGWSSPVMNNMLPVHHQATSTRPFRRHSPSTTKQRLTARPGLKAELPRDRWPSVIGPIHRLRIRIDGRRHATVGCLLRAQRVRGGNFP
jgi:hypothetical protein